jgi:hypothetical protein
MAKSVKVHDDTHLVLKRMKNQGRSKSVDAVIRAMIKQATGKEVSELSKSDKNPSLTKYMEGGS